MNESLRSKMSSISCYAAIGLIYNDFMNSKIKGNVCTKILEQNRKNQWCAWLHRKPLLFEWKVIDIQLRDKHNK